MDKPKAYRLESEPAYFLQQGHLVDLVLEGEELYTSPIRRIGNHEFIPLFSPMRYVADGKIEFDTSKPLGRGSRTFVYEGTLENRNVAIKRIPCVNSNQMNEYREDFKRLEGCVTHVNLVEIYGCFLDNSNIEVYIPMEICMGNLSEWRNGKITDIQVDLDSFPVHQVLTDIGEGLAFLHGKSLIHGDLKPSNILVSQVESQIKMKLADFGIISQPFSSKRKEWKAPEILRAKYYDKSKGPPTKKIKWDDFKTMSKSDIFSLGLVYYWILTKRHPFGDDFVDREYNLKEYNIKVDMELFSKWDLENLKLLEKMLAEDPEHRPSTDEFIHHPILWSNSKTLQFLRNAHDALATEVVEEIEFEQELEAQLSAVNWTCLLCPVVRCYLEESMGKRYRNSVTSLYRAIRNLNEHYEGLPDKVRTALGPKDQMLKCYWLSRFPSLVQILWESCKKLISPDNKYNLHMFYGI